LGIKPEEILAFGDNENDCEMLRMCGIGVAMENAIDAAKEAADLIAGSNEEEGVAHMIDQLVFGEEE
ncbi:MAG: HAD family hydrolase, partial [Clostridia bacterium]